MGRKSGVASDLIMAAFATSSAQTLISNIYYLVTIFNEEKGFLSKPRLYDVTFNLVLAIPTTNPVPNSSDSCTGF